MTTATAVIARTTPRDDPVGEVERERSEGVAGHERAGEQHERHQHRPAMEAGDEENRHEPVEDELVSERPRLSEDERLAEKVLRHRGVRGDSLPPGAVSDRRRADSDGRGGARAPRRPRPRYTGSSRNPRPIQNWLIEPRRSSRRGDDEPAAEEEDEHAALADSERLGREAKCLGPQSLGEVGDHDHHRGDSPQSIEELEATVAGRRVGRRDGTLCGDRHPDSVGGRRNLDR